MKKTIIIGVDGATFNLLDSWLQEKKLKGLAKFLDKGLYGVLHSVEPYVTPSTWTAFSTGKNGGKTGVFDFFNLKADYKFALNSSLSKKSDELWHLIKGKSVILNVPVTYPPQPINGELVTGMLTPGTGVEFTYPKELKETILKNIPSYRIELNGDMYVGKEERFFKELHKMTDDRIKLFKMLLSKNNWELFFGVFIGTDRISHFTWDNQKLLDYYNLIDSFIGDVVDEFGSQSNIFVVSDHGFAKVNRLFAINRWLEKEGYLKRKPSSIPIKILSTMGITRTNIIKVLQKFRIDISTLAVKLPTKLKQALPQTEESLLLNTDWTKTCAFMTSFGQIYLNRVGRFDQGFIEQQEADRLLLEIREKLLKLEYEGIKMVKSVKMRDEVFSGRYASQGPDLVVELIDGFSSYSKFSEEIFPEPGNLKADHAREGVFFALGPDIISSRAKKSAAEGFDLRDLTTTILYLHGVELPSDLDGNVKYELFGNSSSKQKIANALEQKQHKVLEQRQQLDAVLRNVKG